MDFLQWTRKTIKRIRDVLRLKVSLFIIQTCLWAEPQSHYQVGNKDNSLMLKSRRLEQRCRSALLVELSFWAATTQHKTETNSLWHLASSRPLATWLCRVLRAPKFMQSLDETREAATDVGICRLTGWILSQRCLACQTATAGNSVKGQQGHNKQHSQRTLTSIHAGN